MRDVRSTIVLAVSVVRIELSCFNLNNVYKRFVYFDAENNSYLFIVYRACKPRRSSHPNIKKKNKH